MIEVSGEVALVDGWGRSVNDGASGKAVDDDVAEGGEFA
jgi:hypothetical protein